MSKNWAKRKLSYYGPVGVEVSIGVYGYSALTPEEVKAAADDLAEKAMLAMRDARHIHAPLTKIKVVKPREN